MENNSFMSESNGNNLSQVSEKSNKRSLMGYMNKDRSDITLRTIQEILTDKQHATV